MKGYIQARIQVDGGFNDDGEPIASSVDWSKEIECTYQANTLNNRGRYEDGNFTQSTYTIIVYDLDFTATYIRLSDSRSNMVCEKEVQSVEVLENVQRVKVTV